jgi:drug/metabolite transporter (DMT)-like permease
MADGGPFGPASVIVFGLFAAVAWGAGDFGGGLVGRRIAVVVLVLATQLVGMVAALALAIVRAEPVPAPVDIGWSAISGVLGAAGIMALYRGLALGRMGVVAPVTGVLAATVPVAVGVVLEGFPPPVVVAGIVGAVVAVVLVSRVPSEAGARSGLDLALVAGLGIGLFNVTLTRVDDALVFGPLTIARLTSAVVLALAVVALRRRPAIPVSLVPGVVVIGLLDMAGNAGFLLAEQSGSLAVASVLSSLYPVTTVVLAALVLHERVTRDHAAGIALALLAIALIAAGSG